MFEFAEFDQVCIAVGYYRRINLIPKMLGCLGGFMRLDLNCDINITSFMMCGLDSFNINNLILAEQLAQYIDKMFIK